MPEESEIGTGEAEEDWRRADAKPTLKELLLSPVARGALNIPPRRKWKRREPQFLEGDNIDPFTFRR